MARVLSRLKVKVWICGWMSGLVQQTVSEFSRICMWMYVGKREIGRKEMREGVERQIEKNEGEREDLSIVLHYVRESSV